jgi:hypothetical protein
MTIRACRGAASVQARMHGWGRHMIRCIAVAVALASATGALAQVRTTTWNIYASVPMADAKYVEKGEAVRMRLMRCGMSVISDETRNFAGLAPDLFVVMSGPHRSAEDARAALTRAKACGVEGYSRQTRRVSGD